jgi:competence protein ComEC
VSQSLTGWTLRDEADTVFTFPPFTLQPQTTVLVWVKSGSDSSTDLYWGRGSAVWNNTGDVATVRDAGGVQIDSCSYEGGGVEVDCN